MKDINRYLYWNLPEEEATTQASMIVHEIERIPNEGEEFSIYVFRFKIKKKDKNIITVAEVQVKTSNTSNSN